MLATYGIDVLDPATSLRRVKVLAERLPPGRYPDPSHAMSWSYEAYLLAQLIDEVAALHYTTVRAAGGKPPRPKPFPRPAPTRRAAPQKSSWAALADTLSASKTHGVVVQRG